MIQSVHLSQLTTPFFQNGAQSQQVIAVDSSKEVTIIATQEDGNFVVRDSSGNTYSNIISSDLARECGCSSNMCVGQNVIAVDSSKNVTIIALESSGTFVVRDQSGNVYPNILGSDLAAERGRDGDIRTGEKVIAIDSAKEVTVTAIQDDGTFVVKDASGNTYPNIARSDLAVERGSNGNLVVGNQAIAVDSNKQVTMIALQQDGNFVVRDQSGNIYANIAPSDLAPLGQ